MVIRRYRWLWLMVLPLTGFGIGALPHPLYVSITEMNYNETSKNIEVSCKVFTDDIEKALEKKTGRPYHITSAQDPVIAAALASYLHDHLGISFDNKAVTLKYLGYELEKEAVWSYLEGSVGAIPKTAQISNSVLYDFSGEQINLVHITVHGERRSTKLVNPEAKAKLDF
jgi:hypothetical protein